MSQVGFAASLEKKEKNELLSLFLIGAFLAFPTTPPLHPFLLLSFLDPLSFSLLSHF